MNKLQRFCIFTPLKVLVISCIIAVSIGQFSNYRLSQTDIRTGLIVAFPFFILCYNIAYSLLSYTILLNLYKRVRNNVILSFLSFFFPSFITLIIIAITTGKSSDNIETHPIWIMWLISSIPFLIPQTYYFIRFRMGMKKGVFEVNNDLDE